MTDPHTDSATAATAAPPPPAASPARDIPRRAAAAGLAALLVAVAAFLAWQASRLGIPSSDATSYYLPLARAVAEGRHDQAQHLIIPPLYPYLAGWVSRWATAADDPLERAGQLVSALAVLGLVGAVYAVGRSVASRRVGLLAAGLTGVNYWILLFGASVGPDTLYGLLLTLTVLALLHYWRRPGLHVALAAGATAALAALTRSEGLYLLPLAMAVLLARAIRPRPARWRRLLIHAAAMLVLMTATWWPRIAFVRSVTGWPILDARLLAFVPGADDLPSERVLPPAAAGFVRLGPPEEREPALRLEEAEETLRMVFGPVTWLLLIVYLVRRRSLPERPWGRWLIVLAIVGQLLMIAPVRLDRRYVLGPAALFQLFGALGAVAAAAHLARRRDALGRVAGSGRARWIAAVLLLAGLSLWPLLGEAPGARHLELQTLGRLARLRHGGAPVLMATSFEVGYYAGGRTLLVRDPEDPQRGLTATALAELVREHGVDYLVFRTDVHADKRPRETWSRAMTDWTLAGEPPPEVLVGVADADGIRSYLVDARALLDRPDEP